MFFLLYKIGVNLLMPPSIILIFFLLTGICLVKIRFIKRIGLISIIYFTFCLFFYIISIDLGKNFLAKGLEGRYRPLLESDIGDNGCIVMLGGGIREDQLGSFGTKGTSSYPALARLMETAKVYFKTKKIGKDFKIILSGGKVFNEALAEAEVYRDYLLNLGIDENDICMEAESNTTYENAVNVKKLYLKDGDSLILVTSAAHMKRAEYIFKKVGLNPVTAPCDYLYTKTYNIFSFIPNGENINGVKKLLWERLGYLYYKIRYGKKA